MRATTVRLNSATHRSVASLAESSKTSIPAVLKAAVETYRRHVLLERATEGFAKLRKRPKAWAEYRKELTQFETTGSDGL